jgi:asparagine synthase (glutamine-hydrolysing)
MCGIAGRVGSSGGSGESSRAMVASLTHRGPDGQGFFEKPGVELGMARLAVVDVAGGDQPTFDNSGAIATVFNGEIYNFTELRNSLISRGYRFSSHGDCEVISNLYHLHGRDFVHHLRGMFAIVIWDSRENKLILARDRVGKKPLLYSHHEGELLFASEARALLRAGVSRDVDFDALHQVLRVGYINAPLTAYKAISALPPATIATFQNGELSFERYWKIDLTEKEKWSYEESFERVKTSLLDAVQIRTVSERTVGAYLSGGVDSSLVSKFLRDTLDGGLNTYSVSFDHESFDESRYAEAVAKEIGSNHQTLSLEVTAGSLQEALGSLDQPFADSSYFATYFLNKAAREHIVVAFGGDGGDEAMAGYDRYRAIPQLQRLNALMPLLGLGSPLLRSRGRRYARLAEQLNRYESLESRYIDAISLVSRHEEEEIFLPGLPGNGASFLQGLWRSSTGMNAIENLVALDLESYLPGDLLTKADWASMSQSIELRSPMLDHHFLDTCAKVPTAFRANSKTGKILLKELAKREMPGVNFDRPKMGFGIPRAQWLRGQFKDVVRDCLLSSQCRERGWFNHRYLEKQIELHNSGIDRDHIIWPALVIEAWAQKNL